MHFALLGICDASLDLVRAVAASAAHSVTAVFGAGARRDELAQLLSDARFRNDWETLLDEGQADAVIVAVGAWSEARDDQLRKLVQAGLPLLLVHPACEAMVGYELEMIREESGSVLFPFARGQRQTAEQNAIEVAQQGDRSPIGAVEQIVVEHFLADRSAGEVLSAVSIDAGLLFPAIGRIDEISAFGPGSNDRNYSGLSVNLSGTAKIPLRWSVVPVESEPGATATLVGTRGRLVLSMLGEPSAWTLNGSPIPSDPSPGSDDAARAIAEFERAVAGESEPTFAWPDACRTLEIQTAVRDSLRRGRKMRLYDDQYSEQQTFKGKMAVGGCSLLMVALVLLFGFAVYDAVTLPFRDQTISPADAPPQPSTPLWLRLWPAYPLIAFLLLQLCKLVFLTDRRSTA